MQSVLLAGSIVAAFIAGPVQSAVIPRDGSFNLKIVQTDSKDSNTYYLQASGPKSNLKLGVMVSTTTPSSFTFDTENNVLLAQGKVPLGAAFERKSYVDLKSTQVPLYFAKENTYETVVKHTFGFDGDNLTIGGKSDWWLCDQTDDLSGGNADLAVYTGRAGLGQAWLGEPREGCKKISIAKE